MAGRKMPSRESPGLAPLGHEPFSNVKLEGPKKHHDDHGPNASVPAKGDARAIPGEHWEMRYNQYGVWSEKPSGAFLGARSQDRPQPHDKLNAEDH